MPRIVSLQPHLTEMVAGLGLGNSLVARSHACDYPASVRATPPCTEPKVAIPGIGYGLGERDRALVQENLCPYRVDAVLLRDLRPDIIFTQFDTSDAVTGGAMLEKAARAWFGDTVRIVSLEVTRLPDIWHAVHRIASELGVEQDGRQLAMQLQQRMAAILSQALTCTQRPRVACLAALEPLLPSGGCIPELVEIAGGKRVLPADSQQPWTPEALRTADPELIVLLCPGWSREQARLALRSWQATAAPGAVSALQEGEIALCDASPIFFRLGPRIVDALEVLAEIIHPDEFQFGHQGQLWEPA